MELKSSLIVKQLEPDGELLGKVVAMGLEEGLHVRTIGTRKLIRAVLFNLACIIIT